MALAAGALTVIPLAGAALVWAGLVIATWRCLIRLARSPA